MDDPLRPVCGNCKFGVPADENNICCFGSPPTPVLMGQRPGLLAGQVQFNLQNIRPILSKTETPCAVYQPQEYFELGAKRRDS